ncbi:O-antigen ligase [Acaryochloris marina]|uniref:O-antigen ligase family protein n=1 Tax=Acaryochloris marina TaxID=155978 RepID=UPI001BAEB7BB|nr:O-antigen ligase family protein [Acaryochloris marina]QUY44995.1 O-antigen ligase family protein [Acaryochloris marina S15]
MKQILNWLVLLFIFSVPIEQIIFLPGLGTITRVMGLLLFLAWAANLILKKQIRWPHPFHIAACLFFSWSIGSIFWSHSLPETLERANTYTQLGILIFILWDRLKSEAASRSAMQAYIFGVYVSVASTYSNFLAGNHGKFGRFAAGNFDDNDLGIIISLGIPMAWYLLVSDNQNKANHPLKVTNTLFIPIAISGILLTASRTAMISLAPSLLYIVSAIRNFTFVHQALFFGLGTICIFALPFIIPAETFSRLSTAGDSISSGDMNGRGEIWKEGLFNYSQEPLFGVGSGAFKTTVEADHVAHNTFLSSLFEVGFIGLLLLLTVFLIAIICSARFSRLWIVVFSILFIGAMSLSWEHRKPTWVIMSLGIIHSQNRDYFEQSNTRQRSMSSQNYQYLSRSSSELNNFYD